jgi:mevalonate kinase
MFIIIYNDGTLVTKDDLDTAFSLRGHYHVFSTGKTFELNKEDGVCYYDNKKTLAKFKTRYLELVDIKKTSSSNYPYQFSVYDSKKESIRKFQPNMTNFENALSFVVKKIISASQFQDWDSYEKETQKLEVLTTENNDLKKRLDTIIKQLEELNNKFSSLQKP